MRKKAKVDIKDSMKEILFRAFDIDKKEFILFNLKEPDEYLFGRHGVLANTVTKDWEQYIGLKDENKQKAFEGDIIFVGEHYEGDHRYPPTIYEIIFEDGEFFGTSANDEYMNLLDAFRNYNAIIIGNIYENPTLKSKLEG